MKSKIFFFLGGACETTERSVIYVPHLLTNVECGPVPVAGGGEGGEGVPHAAPGRLHLTPHSHRQLRRWRTVAPPRSGRPA